MRPLAGHVVGVKQGVVTVKLETGNKRQIQTDKQFKYGDKVRVNFDFNAGTVRSIELYSTPPAGTEKCQRCCETHIEYGEDNIEDIW